MGYNNVMETAIIDDRKILTSNKLNIIEQPLMTKAIMTSSRVREKGAEMLLIRTKPVKLTRTIIRTETNSIIVKEREKTILSKKLDSFKNESINL